MLKLEPRPQVSKAWTYASPVLALAITVLIGVALFALLGKDPVRGLQAFFWEPIKSGYALGELAMKATPLLLVALGLAVCFRSNVWNIGAEGRAVWRCWPTRTPGRGSCPPFWWRVFWAACSGPASWPSCATASMPTRRWSA